jgi:hypothetical protein
MNSREKRAEQLNKAKKYYGEYAEFKVGMAKGRHYAKHEAYLSHREKIFDETNNCYKEQLEARDYESVVKEDLAQIKLYNNARHSALKDKKTKELKYDGMSRMQVLQMRQNTQAGLLNWRLLCKEWGIVRETSLKQGATFTVDYREWWLSDASIIKRFNPHNTGALAYFIPDNNGKVNEIYVYQGDRFIDCPRDLGTFQEAIAERTDEDIRIMNRQLGYKSSQKKLGKDAAQELLLGKIGSMKTETVNAVITADYESEITNYEQAEQVSELVEDYGGWVSEDWAAKALNSI